MLDKSVETQKKFFVTFVGNNFLGQTVSFGICQGVVFSRDKIHCLDPSKQPRALANLWTLASLASQIQNAKLRLRLRSAFVFFNLASLCEKLGQITSVVFQGPDNYILVTIQESKWFFSYFVKPDREALSKFSPILVLGRLDSPAPWFWRA